MIKFYDPLGVIKYYDPKGGLYWAKCIWYDHKGQVGSTYMGLNVHIICNYTCHKVGLVMKGAHGI